MADLFSEVGSVVQEPLEPFAEAREFLDDLILQYEAGVEWDEPHH